MGQLVRPKTDVVWLRILIELHGIYLLSPLQKGLGRAVHAVHHSTARREDDREREICLLDQFDVFDHRTPRRSFALGGGGVQSEPLLVQFSDISE
jgi:hypothetical protein